MNERDLFIAALQIEDLRDRAAYLDRACNDDDLRQRCEALLAAFGQAGSFLQPPAAAAAATSDVLPAGRSRNSSPAEGSGTVIGPYKLLQQIGEGGMGTVWMAEQNQPVQRKVALKLIKSGMDSTQVIARFEAERQALALMDHPNIARVLDAGATEGGRPYFVMELVKGVPITNYCDEHRLTPKQRLELFVPVCQAVQHAHQKGIIHRDLKPSNIMVCLYDGKPVPKVIDFGVAKATGQKLTERTMFTELGQVVGTLEYMSPEQAELNQLDIDTRSDIYSLGVLLYELLTGTTPLERKRFEAVAFLEVLRLIREEESPKPSTRLSTVEGLPSIAANRGLEPKKLSGLMRGELDWIVMKTLEKDRSRRYETANGLAMDVQRYLLDEPVQACPPSALYRFRKFAQRNKRTVAVTATAVGSAVAALILTVVLLAIHSVRIQEEQDRTSEEYQRAEGALREAKGNLQRADEEQVRTGKEYQRAESALREAEGNLQRADQNLGLALEALDDLCLKDVENRIFRDRRISGAERESLQRGLAFYERFAAQNRGHPELQGVMAKAFRRAGFLRLALQDWQEARANFTKAIPVLEQLAADPADSAPYRRELARCCYGLSRGLVKERRYREAEPTCRRAIALLEKLAAEFPHEPNYRVELGHSLWLLGEAFGDGGILFTTSRPEEAEKISRQSLRVFEALAAEYPKERFYRQETAFSHRQLSTLFAKTGRPELALVSRRQAVAIYADLVTEVPNSVLYRRELAYTLGDLSNSLQANQQTLEAEQAYRQAVGIYHKLVLESNQESDRWALGYGHQKLGLLRKKAGQLDEAAEHLRVALVVWEKLVADFNKDDYRGHWFRTYGDLVKVLMARAREVEKDTNLSPAERQAAAQPYHDEARGLVRDGLKKGRPFEAELLLIENLAELKKMHGADHLETSIAMHRLGLNYLKGERYAQAEPLFRACLLIREKEQPDAWTTFNTRTRLGAALLGQRKYAEAEPFLLQGYEGLKKREAEIPDSEKYGLTEGVNWLIQLYDARGQKDKADEWRQKKLPTPADNKAEP